MSQDNEQIKTEQIVTVGDVFGLIFNNKIFLAVASVVIALVVFFAIWFGLNPSRYKFVSDFSYSYSTNGSLSEMITYPDGEAFNYSDLVSKDRLNAVKNFVDEEGNKPFNNVDVDKMLKQGGISLTKTVDKDTSLASYTLTVGAGFFESPTVAKEFVKKIVEYPVERTGKFFDELSLDNNLSAFDDAITYENKINHLSAQYGIISNGITAFIDEFTENYPVNSLGKTLANFKREFNNYTAKHQLSNFTAKYKEEGFVFDNSYLQNYKTKKFNLTQEKKFNEAEIDTQIANLKASSPDTSSSVIASAFYGRIVELTQRNREIDEELEYIEKYIENIELDQPKTEAEQDMIEELNDIRAQYQIFTDDFEKISAEIGRTRNQVNYVRVEQVKGDGKISGVIAIVLSVIVGVILGLGLVLIVKLPKLIHDKRA